MTNLKKNKHAANVCSNSSLVYQKNNSKVLEIAIPVGVGGLILLLLCIISVVCLVRKKNSKKLKEGAEELQEINESLEDNKSKSNRESQNQINIQQSVPTSSMQFSKECTE